MHLGQRNSYLHWQVFHFERSKEKPIHQRSRMDLKEKSHESSPFKGVLDLRQSLHQTWYSFYLWGFLWMLEAQFFDLKRNLWSYSYYSCVVTCITLVLILVRLSSLECHFD